MHSDLLPVWLANLRSEITFYHRAVGQRRTDAGFPWALIGSQPKAQTLRGLARSVLQAAGHGREPDLSWLEQNAANLWEARSLLADDLSRVIFDRTLVLRNSTFSKYFFPYLETGSVVQVLGDSAFQHPDFPQLYAGLPLHVYDLRLVDRSSQLQLLSFDGFPDMVNAFRQYLVRRGTVDFTPRAGDVVFDCGACVGDMTLLFAGCVGRFGRVHAFDPVPLHERFCLLQVAANPTLAETIQVNLLAVGDRNGQIAGDSSNAARIAPGGIGGSAYTMTCLDDYSIRSEVRRLDYIKMDIEGHELGALDGAASIIRAFKPRLAVCAYHRPADLWEIPAKLLAIHPRYRLYFGHHSPVGWESVIYADDPSASRG